MNSFGIFILINLFLLSILLIQSASSVSFPSLPQKPPPDATPEEQALFWKLLHNYYAILARPRFGKRDNSDLVYSKYPSYLAMIKRRSMPLQSGEQYPDYLSNQNPIDVNNYYSLEYLVRRRRR